MQEQNQKERLEQELKFLKESYEAEVISREEFEKGKGRIDVKLREIEKTGQDNEAAKQEATNENATNTGNKEKEAVKLDLHEEKTGTKPEIAETKEKITEQTAELIPEKQEDNHQKNAYPKESKAFKYAVVFVVLILIAFFAYSLASKDKGGASGDKAELKFECYENDDCINAGVAGICENIGTKYAKCAFIEKKKAKVSVLNYKNECFNCDTERVIGILEGWFGDLEVQEMDYGTAEGKKFAESIGAVMVPSYAVFGDISQIPEFETFSRAFAKKGDMYILSDDAAGSTFYIQRVPVQNKLDLFAREGDAATASAQRNIKEFLDAIPGVEYEVHNAGEAMTQELGIRTFPSFLINNRIRFSGIHSAETIKENFCKLNKVEGCDKELSTNLI